MFTSIWEEEKIKQSGSHIKTFNLDASHYKRPIDEFGYNDDPNDDDKNTMNFQVKANIPFSDILIELHPI